ncbi:MAG: hypothetical protein ACRCTZ_18565 [Sarcina sp.]
MIDRVTAKGVKKFSKESGYDYFIDDKENLIYISTINYKYILTYHKKTRRVTGEDFNCKGKSIYKHLKKKYGIGVNFNKMQAIFIILGALIAIAGAVLFAVDNNLIMPALIAFGVGVVLLAIGIISAV